MPVPSIVRLVHAARRLAPSALLGFLALGFVEACGGSLPARFVIEHDLGDLSYRRYQHVLDVELPVEGNAAEGHTATYVRREPSGAIPYVNVFVTVYDHAPGLAAEIRQHVSSLASYTFSVVDLEGGRMFALDGGSDDRWWLWVSGNRVVKVGGTADEALVRRVLGAYLSVYPSDLDEHGRARDGTPSAGAATASTPASEGELDLPSSLRGGDASGTSTATTP